MYTVIIADDEATTRERLSSFLAKKTDDFKVLGVYENGYDALESGIPLEPDLLITDIKMPFIDGLELIRRAKQELPLLQAIIVSGFDSFDYARQAIDLGVIGYITKPVTFDDISSSLAKAKAELDRKLMIDKNIKDLQQKNESVLKAVQNSDLNKLVTLKSLPVNFRGRLKADGIEIDKRYALFAVFDSDKEEDDLTYEESELGNFYLEQFIRETFDGSSFSTFMSSVEKNLLLLSDEPFRKEDLQVRLAKIIAKIKKTCNLSFSVGVSDFGDARSEISYRKLYRHARWTLEYRTVVGTNVVLFYSDLAKKGNVIGKVDENEFKSISYSILYGKTKAAKAAVGRMLDTISSIEYKDSYFLIINNLLDSVLKSCIAIDKLYASYLPHMAIVNGVYGSKNSDSTKQLFTDLIDRIAAINNAERISGVDDAYDHIRHYIEANYAKADLSLDNVADELGYSVSYISAILKKHDTSFTKCLTAVRMDKAKALLANPNNKMATIASEIGYEDPYYFSHCFKKYFGVSPMEYRKS
jgi:two-component system response regulator YesN